jgi:hypothetical protein
MSRKERSNRALAWSVWAVCERLELRTLLSGVSFNSVLAFPAEPVPSSGKYDGGSVRLAIAELTPGNPYEDIVTAVPDTSVLSTVNILYGNGDGTFQAPVNIGTLGSVSCITVADVNGDGAPDIVVGYENSGTDSYYLRVFLNHTGTFSNSSSDAYSIPLDASPTSLAAGNFYIDNPRQSVVVATEGPFNDAELRYSYVDLVSADMYGVFDSFYSMPITTGSPPADGVYSVAVANLEGHSSDADIVLANSQSSMLSVLIGKGDGYFNTYSANAPFAPTSVAVGYFNDDGYEDVVLGDGSHFSILTSNHLGSLTFAQTIVPAYSFTQLAVANVDPSYSGYSDVVVAGQSGSASGGLDPIPENEASVFLGNGGGTVQATPVSTPFFDGPSVNSIAVADVNGDTNPDIILGGTGAANVLLNGGDGMFESEPVIGTHSYGDNATVGNFYNNGSPDVAVTGDGLIAEDYNGVVSVLQGDGSGLGLPTAHSGGGDQPEAVAAGQFVEGSSYQGVVDVSTYTTNVFLNTDGTLTLSSSLDAGDGNDVAVGNFQSGSFQDIAVATVPHDSVAGGVSVLLNNDGDGTFQSPHLYAIGSCYGVAVGKFDTSSESYGAYEDIVAANNADDEVSVLINNGHGTFSTVISTSLNSTYGLPVSVAVGDFNGDGIPDVVVGCASGTLLLLIGEGDGHFYTPTHPAIAYHVCHYCLAAADFNGDGFSDLVIASYYNDTVSVLMATGTGSAPFFKPAQEVGLLNFEPSSLAIADFNHDGQPDILVTGNGIDGAQGQASVLLNTIVTLKINAGEPFNPQRAQVVSLTISFAVPVQFSTNPFTLTGHDDLTDIDSITPAFSYSPDDGELHTTYTITFTEDSGNADPNQLTALSGSVYSLPDGAYTLTVTSVDVKDSSGNAVLAGDATFNFYRLFGDFYGAGAGVVNFNDLDLWGRYDNTSVASSNYWFMGYDGSTDVNFDTLLAIGQVLYKSESDL